MPSPRDVEGGALGPNLTDTLASLTCTKFTTTACPLPLQQYTLWGHLSVESCLDVVHEGAAVRAVYPDPLTQRVFNVYLRWIRFGPCLRLDGSPERAARGCHQSP